MDTVAPRKGFDVVAYLKLFRFPLVFTAIADSAVGGLLARPHWDVLALLALSSAGLYFFGMGLNDIADRERDKRLAPGRVLPSGRLSLRSARWAVLLALLLSLSATIAIGYDLLIQRLVIWGLVVAFISAYNLFLKIPPVMGLVRSFNLLLGLSAVIRMGPDSPAKSWVFALVALPTFIYVSALTYVSTLEDMDTDRTKVFVGAALMVVGALLAATMVHFWIYIVDGVSAPTGAVHRLAVNWHGIVFATPLAAWTLRRAWGARDKKGVMLMVRDGVGGIILLDAALLASDRGLIPGLCIAALVIPAALSIVIFKRLA